MERHVKIIFFILIILIPYSYTNAIEFTQEDRDRLIRLEIKLEATQKQIDDLNTTTQKQIDDLNTTIQKQIDDLKATIQKQIDDLKATTQKQIDDLKATIQKQIDNLRIFMLWGFGILFGGMGILIGFVIWDRRTAVEPVIKKNRELEEREEKLEKALKEYAKVEPKLSEILKSLNL